MIFKLDTGDSIDLTRCDNRFFSVRQQGNAERGTYWIEYPVYKNRRGGLFFVVGGIAYKAYRKSCYYGSKVNGHKYIKGAEAVDTEHLAASSYKEKKFSMSLTFYECDADVIEKLKSVPNKTEYIRNLIREDIAK